MPQKMKPLYIYTSIENVLGRLQRCQAEIASAAADIYSQLEKCENELSDLADAVWLDLSDKDREYLNDRKL